MAVWLSDGQGPDLVISLSCVLRPLRFSSALADKRWFLLTDTEHVLTSIDCDNYSHLVGIMIINHWV